MSGLGPNLGKSSAQLGGDGGVVSGADDNRVSVPARRARGEGDNSCPKGLLSCRGELLVAAGTGGRAKKKKNRRKTSVPAPVLLQLDIPTNWYF